MRHEGETNKSQGKKLTVCFNIEVNYYNIR